MSVLSAIGNTPIAERKSYNGNARVRILAKLEGNNPGGSVKHRPAHYMIQIVVILPDRGDRYLSTTLFRAVCAKCPP